MTEHSIEIVNQDPGYLAPVTTIESALRRYQAMKDFVNSILKKDIDYGVIPGTGTKPVLLKPGAEKLCSFFGLAITYRIIEQVTDWTGAEHGGEPFFFFNYKVRLYKNQQIAGEGEGSCNSWEKKYRYRKSEKTCPECGRPAIIRGKKEYGGGWICFTKKGGCGAKFSDQDPAIMSQPEGDVPNPDVADLVNTIQKMAQKRALIAASLNATNASDWFTQDLEDFITYDYQDQDQERHAPIIPTITIPPQNNLGGKEQDQGPDPVAAPSEAAEPEMTLEEACKMVNSQGEFYYTLSKEKLANMTKGIATALANPETTQHDRRILITKRKAIQVLLKAKNDGSIA